MEKYLKILKQQEVKHASTLLKKHGLKLKQLDFGGDGCPPLYLAKPHWTNRFDPDRESTLGIFCSIWVAPTMLKKKHFAYNIHAKTLAKLPGYQLKPREFAAEFRALVKSDVSAWPNIRLDYGPSTLLQGKEICELDSFAEKVEERILGFVDIYEHIDDLLEQSST